MTITLQLSNLPASCARKLFKPSKDAASLLDYIEKNWKVLDVRFLWVTSEVW